MVVEFSNVGEAQAEGVAEYSPFDASAFDLDFKNPEEVYSYEDSIFDYEQIESINQVMNEARLTLFKITDSIIQHERELVVAKTRYRRAYMRSYLEATQAKNESERKLRAELANEELEDAALVAEQIVKELNRRADTIRQELRALESLGNNVRQQMRV